MRLVNIILMCIICNALFSCAQSRKDKKLSNDIRRGLDLYEQVQETPKRVRNKENYAAAIVYGGARGSYWAVSYTHLTLPTKA